MRVIVVDDEEPARRRLGRLLERNPGVEVVGEAATGDEALACIARTRPDAVFLDIRMPGLDGLALAQRYAPLPPFVFVTAYDEHAVAAFDVNAVDYLVKPVSPERLAAAVARLAERLAAGAPPARGLAVLGGAVTSARVLSSLRGEIHLFDARDVTRFWASDKYTIFVADGIEQITEEPLSALEQRLAPFGFLRVHRAELINVTRVKALVGDEGQPVAVLDDAQRVRVSRRSLGALKAALGLR